MNLVLNHIVKKGKERSFVDNRRIVNFVTAEYLGDDGHQYRKRFESYGEPEVPTSGSNAALSKMKIQWFEERGEA